MRDNEVCDAFCGGSYRKIFLFSARRGGYVRSVGWGGRYVCFAGDIRYSAGAGVGFCGEDDKVCAALRGDSDALRMGGYAGSGFCDAFLGLFLV